MKRIITNTALFCLILFSIFSCKKQEINQFPSIKISPDLMNSNNNIDDIFKSIEFVALETNELSLIKEISRVFVVGDTIILGDFELGKICLFNDDGTFISSFCHLGKGPGEYVDIDDMCYDFKHNCILISNMGRILEYSINGEFINKIDLNRSTGGAFFEVFSNNIVHKRNCLLFSGYKNHDVVITNRQQEYINSGCIIPEQVIGLAFSDNKNMSESDGLLYSLTYFNDTIFAVNNQLEITPRYIISCDKKMDLKKSNLKNKKFNDIVQFTNAMRNSNLIINISDLYVFSDYIFFNYLRLPYNPLVVYSKIKDQTTIYNSANFTDDGFLFDPVGKTESHIISLLSPSLVKLEDINKYLEEPVDLNSNPILCFLELK